MARGIDEKDIVVEFASRKQVPEKLAACDWGISFIKPSYSKTASSPTKMGEMLAMGIPLVVNGNVGDVKEITHRTGGGICLDDFSAEQVTKAVNQVREGIQPDPIVIRSKSFEIYSLEKAVKDYVSIYDSILK